MCPRRSLYFAIYLILLFCVSSEAIETAQLPTPDESIIHELDGARNVIKSFHDTKDNELQIFCRNADSKNLFNYFRTAKLRLLSTSEDIKIITGLSPAEVYYKYLSSTKWFNWATNLLPWRVREASFPTFNRSCIGVSTTKEYDVNLIIRPIDPWNLALFVTGVGLFWSAPNLVRSTTFFYGSGTAIGALASPVVVIFIVYRILPKNKFSYTTLAAIWSVSLYFAGESYSRFEELVHEKLPYVLVYLTTGALIALITCYRVGQPNHPKSLDILKWLLQLFSVWLIHMSSEFIEMSTAIIVILVVSYYFGRRLRLMVRPGERSDTAGSGKRRDSTMTSLLKSQSRPDFKFKKLLGKGRFGSVVLVTLHEEEYAAKFSRTIDYESWNTECEVFRLVNEFEHPNVLRFYDQGTSGSELWLLIQYHSKGSLFDLLQKETLSQVELVELARDVSSAIKFLHEGVYKKRPSICHRDIKSQNVLISSKSRAVLADFGLALVQALDGRPKFPSGFKVCAGTVRYMSPETLTSSINSFDEFKESDVYSLGLVLWELAWNVGVRFQPLKKAPKYRLPFEKLVGRDPSVEEMMEVVCTQGHRPHIPAIWKENDVLDRFTHVMRKCWKRQGQREKASEVLKVFDDILGISST